MIVDRLSNAANYYGLHPLFEKAFDFIGQLDMSNLSTGNVEIIENRLKVSIVETGLKLAEEAMLETHKRFIDIQIPVSKPETFGWRSASTLAQPTGQYDTTKDIAFFNDAPSTLITLQPSEFVIFTPDDGHAPLIGEGLIKKIIVKVAID